MSIKSAWDRYKENLGETRPWDLLKSETPMASDEEAEKRYSACLGCEHLIQATKQCTKCGCFMQLKTKLAKAHCPVGKW